MVSAFAAIIPCSAEIIPCLFFSIGQSKTPEKASSSGCSEEQVEMRSFKTAGIPCNIPCYREIVAETGSLWTTSTATNTTKTRIATGFAGFLLLPRPPSFSPTSA
jgi:hypothetical protein